MRKILAVLSFVFAPLSTMAQLRISVTFTSSKQPVPFAIFTLKHTYYASTFYSS